MIDLNLIDKGADYEELNKSFVIFICTFDMFKEGRCIYTFENRCAQNPRLTLGDGAVKVFVSTKGRSGTVDAKLERFARLIGHMNADGRGNDIVKVCEDPDYRKTLYEEYGI